MLRSLFNALLDFAGRKFAEEYRGGDATSPIAARLPCSGYDETAQAIALGGASLAQEFRGDRTGPRPDHIEFRVHHDRGEY